VVHVPDVLELRLHLQLVSLRQVRQEVASRLAVRDLRDVLLVASQERFVGLLEYFLRVVFELEDVEVGVYLSHPRDRSAGAAEVLLFLGQADLR